MDNSILIGKYLHFILTNDADLMELVPADHIYGCDIRFTDTTAMPYVVYNTSITVDNTKDKFGDVGHVNDVVVMVQVYENTYTKATLLANEVRHALEDKGYRDDDIYIERMDLNTVDCDYSDQYGPCYRYTLMFRTTVH